MEKPQLGSDLYLTAPRGKLAAEAQPRARLWGCTNGAGGVCSTGVLRLFSLGEWKKN